MPSTKLVFVKLLLELADDSRFTMELNDSQKLDYLLLLLMAGLTSNEIPQDFEWFKSRFHLEKKPTEIELNIRKIREVYKKIMIYNGKIKFKKFKELHNYIYKEKDSNTGILKEFYKNSPIESNLFLFISNLISFYFKEKGIREEDADDRDRGRAGKQIKELLIKSKGKDDLVREAISWVAHQGYCDWTLETVSRKWADFMKTQHHKEAIKNLDDEALKQFKELEKRVKENPITPDQKKELRDRIQKIGRSERDE